MGAGADRQPLIPVAVGGAQNVRQLIWKRGKVKKKKIHILLLTSFKLLNQTKGSSLCDGDFFNFRNFCLCRLLSLSVSGTKIPGYATVFHWEKTNFLAGVH